MINKDKFTQLINKIRPEKIIGISGLAILCSISLITFVPGSNSSSATLAVFLSSIGLNVLSGVVSDFYSSLITYDEKQEEKATLALAKAISLKMKDDVRLRKDLEFFLEKSNALVVTNQLASDNLVSINWVVQDIKTDISSYRNEFIHLRQELAAIENIAINIQKDLRDGLIKMEAIFQDAVKFSEKERERELFEAKRKRIILNLTHKFSSEDLEKMWAVLGFNYKDFLSELSRRLGFTANRDSQIQEILKQVSSIDKIIQAGKSIRPEINWEWVFADDLKEWQNFNWGFSANNYIKNIQHLYGHMRIMGQPRPVSLDGVFTDVYLLDKPTAWRRYSIDKIQNIYLDRFNINKPENRSTGIEAVSKNNRLFILGKPGAGKTTFLKYITIQAAKGAFDKIPIFISLKEYSDQVDRKSNSHHTLLDFIVKQFDICGFPSPQNFIKLVLKTGKAIILFDGLDEVNQEGGLRVSTIQSIKNFTEAYNECQYLITCRVAATEYVFERFTYVEIADFLVEQVKIFAYKWFGNNHEKAQLFLSDLYKSENVGLQELAKNPLLLTMLCIVFEDTMTFPQRRVEIYEEALDALFKKWDSSRNIRRDDIYRELSLGRKRQLLTQIAFNSFAKAEYFIKESDLVDHIKDYLVKIPPNRSSIDIDGATVLRSIEAQHGILIERATGIHSFAHLTFQEYFVSKYIAENYASGSIDFLLTKIHNINWREVFLLTTSLLHNADDFLLKFSKKLVEASLNSSIVHELLTWVNETAKSNNQTKNLVGNRIWILYKDLERAFYIASILESAGIRYDYQSSELSEAIEFIREIGDLLIPNERPENNLIGDRQFDFNSFLILATLLAEKYGDGGDPRILIPLIIKVNGGLKFSAKYLEKDEDTNYFLSINFPSKASSPKEWHEYCNNIYRKYNTYPKNYRNYDSFNIKQITRYLRCANLFANCVNLGYLTNINPIIGNLLLPAVESI